MCEVHAVFEHILRVHFQALPIQSLLRIVAVGAAAVVEPGEDVRRVEVRFTAFDVVPEVDRLVAFHHRIGADSSAAIRAVLIRDADVAALLAPLPPVERTLQHLADDFAAETQVCAEVLAVGVHRGQLTGLGAPGNHLLAEVLHLVDITGADLVRPANLKPSGRFHRQRRFGHDTDDNEPRHKFIVGTMKISKSGYHPEHAVGSGAATSQQQARAGHP
jgi:hypothetical protein